MDYYLDTRRQISFADQISLLLSIQSKKIVWQAPIIKTKAPAECSTWMRLSGLAAAFFLFAAHAGQSRHHDLKLAWEQPLNDARAV